MSLEDAKKYMDGFKECVVATVNPEGNPQAATVGFSIDEKFQVIIATNESTRKANNISNNSNIALVVGFSGDTTLQYEGIAEKTPTNELGSRLEEHFKKLPGAKKFANDAGQAYFLIKPTWLRFTDYTAEDEIFETRDF